MHEEWQKVLVLSHHPRVTLLLWPTCRAPREMAPTGWYKSWVQTLAFAIHALSPSTTNFSPEQLAFAFSCSTQANSWEKPITKLWVKYATFFAHKSRSQVLWFIGHKGRHRKVLHPLSWWGSPNTSLHQSAICLRIWSGFAIVQAKETIISSFK